MAKRRKVKKKDEKERRAKASAEGSRGRRPKVAVRNEQELAVDVAGLKRVLRSALAALRLRGVEISVLLVGEAEMAALNARYRDEPEATDTLAFPATEDFPAPDKLSRDAAVSCLDARRRAFPEQVRMPIGDLAICPAVCARYALQHGQPLEQEICAVAMHGLLHLLGFDHGTPEEAARMQQEQAFLLAT
ncbi:MAG: rRNA maturation RNase YbeY [Candidatus Schekmanbacteria bacterium]|nr:rRNA maturation RNase YbeY [Candidatus Schekmanbacteria bacterium]